MNGKLKEVVKLQYTAQSTVIPKTGWEGQLTVLSSQTTPRTYSGIRHQETLYIFMAKRSSEWTMRRGSQPVFRRTL